MHRYAIFILNLFLYILAVWWHHCKKWSAERSCFNHFSVLFKAVVIHIILREIFNVFHREMWKSFYFQKCYWKSLFLAFSRKFKMYCQRKMITWKLGLSTSISHKTSFLRNHFFHVDLPNIFFARFFAKMCLGFWSIILVEHKEAILSQTSDLLSL